MLSVILHTFCRYLPNAHSKKFPRFYTTLSDPHTNTKQGLYCIHKNKKHYEHTPYPTHLKLIVKNKDHAYAEQLIPHSRCVVVYTSWYFSLFKLNDNACAPSMMDDRSANFGAAQYTVKYSNFTFYDKLLNSRGEMNNAVTLILTTFIWKARCCATLGIWIEQYSSCSRNQGFKRPDLKICKNVVMDYFNVSSLDLPWGKEEHLQVVWHIWSRQD